MPFTPFHFGPSGLIGLLFSKLFDLFALLVSCVIVDVEPFFVLIFGLNYPMHGYCHTFLFGTLIALALSAILYKLRQPIAKIMSIFKLAQISSFPKILLSCLVGIYSHVALDSFLYTDIRPFYPASFNPFLGKLSQLGLIIICGLLFIAGAGIYIYRFRAYKSITP